MPIPLAGEASCLAAAAIWACTVSMFRAPLERHGARAVNLAKCVIASVLLGGTTVAVAGWGGVVSASARDLALIAASGLVGLTFGDTALFAAVRRLGPYRALLLQTMAPVFTAVTDLLWRGATLSPLRQAGMLATLAGIALVVAPRRGGGEGPGVAALGGASLGIAYGVLAALGQGTGVVLAKEGMAGVAFVPASFLRLATAAGGLVLVGFFDGTVARASEMARSAAAMGRVLPASFLGSYVGILLMMAGIAGAPAPVAAVLLATTPIFSLFLDVARRREALTVRNVAGTILAVAGVAML